MSLLVIYEHLLPQLLCNYSLLEIAWPRTRTNCFANQNSTDSIKAMKGIMKNCFFFYLGVWSKLSKSILLCSTHFSIVADL